MEPDPDPNPDPTPFFSNFKNPKKFIFIFFSYNLPAGTLSSVLKYKIKFFAKDFVLKFYFASSISVRSTPL
jgi:hypothetical protein